MRVGWEDAMAETSTSLVPGKARFRLILGLFLAFVAIEIGVFAWLCSLPHEGFESFVVEPDTRGYLALAKALLETGTLIPSGRTLGYPLFLCLCFSVGGDQYGYHIAIGLQLVANLGFSLLVWRLLEGVAGHTEPTLRAVLTAVFFWAGMGMALSVLSDFQAALCFAGFAYVLLFKRSWAYVLLGGASLAMATLTRPVFTLFPLLIPVLGLLVSRFGQKVPRSHVLAYVLFAGLAVGVSFMQEHRVKHLTTGSWNYATFAICSTLQDHVKDYPTDYHEGQRVFAREIEKRAGRPYSSLTRGEQERFARALLFEEIISDPAPFTLSYGKTFLKYLFVPIENIVRKVTCRITSEGLYYSAVRPILFALCLPLWLFSIFPPIGQRRKFGAYYVFEILILCYLLGLASLVGTQGERMRFPVLALMLPVAAINLQAAGHMCLRIVASLKGRCGTGR